MPKNLLHWKMGKNSNIQGNVVHLLYFLHFFFLVIFKIIKRDKHRIFFFPVFFYKPPFSAVFAGPANNIWSWNCMLIAVMLKHRPSRLQTADCTDRVDRADWVLFFYLYINFLVKFLL